MIGEGTSNDSPHSTPAIMDANMTWRDPGGSDRVGHGYVPVANRGTEEPHPDAHPGTPAGVIQFLCLLEVQSPPCIYLC